ncbi:MAG: hypothetical protein HRU38_21975 [Saccharospirillaceae bacterium]|nr:hypothetical protein [Pseudomonadales bacterium]NRB81298.1 hypothetical protein [Saccharospirillaceae bacterium]
MKFDDSFREHYCLYGPTSGQVIHSLNELKQSRDSMNLMDLNIRPESFIGYTFSNISRVSFYSVIPNEFAESVIYEKENGLSLFNKYRLVP